MDDSEDRRDLELLTRQLSANSSSLSSSSSSVHSSGFSINETWPLYVTPAYVDHYICGDLIGTGSYAQVRECIDTNTLERCAMKVINKDYLRRQAPSALSNQLQEIRLLRHLRHPNIIQMKECLFKGNKIYLILEYCSFVLSELIGDDNQLHQLDVPLARNLFTQLCSGLKYLHSLGIVHRDIKPQNLLIANCGCLKIIDFGVCQVLSMWSSNDVCFNFEGSPLFQAPEVVCGQPEYAGFKVDVWSAGVTLYLMLYGQYPFFDETLLGLYDKILSQDLEVPPRAPTQLALTDLLAAMLDKEANKRASIDEILGHSWLRLRSNHESDDEHGEFIEMILSRKHHRLDGQQNEPPTELLQQAHVYERDIYRSISVLPYLYKHHYPNANIVKVKQRTVVGSMSSANNSGSRSCSPSSSPTTTTDTSQILDSPDQSPVEWGTKEQYQLLKVPPVRANRLPGRRRRHRRRGGRPPGHGRLSTSLNPALGRRHYRRPQDNNNNHNKR